MFSSQAQENESDNNNPSVDSEQRSPPKAKGRGFIPSTAKPTVEVTIGKVGVEVAESGSSTAKLTAAIAATKAGGTENAENANDWVDVNEAEEESNGKGAC